MLAARTQSTEAASAASAARAEAVSDDSGAALFAAGDAGAETRTGRGLYSTPNQPFRHSLAPKYTFKNFELAGAGSEPVSVVLHPDTKVVSVDRLPFESVPKYPDLQNAWWKYPSVQAWLHSFETGEYAGLVEMDRSVFGAPVRQDILAQVLQYERNWLEQGTESTKNLGQVRGSTRKPFPQKGRGKARHGTLRAPHFVGGYASHGPRPHDKSTDIPRKVYDLGIRTALSTKFAQDQVIVVDRLAVDSTDKEAMRSRLRSLGIGGRKSYFLFGAPQPCVQLLDVMDTFKLMEPTLRVPEGERPLLAAAAEHVSATALLEYEMLVLDKEAIEVLEQMYRRA